MSIALTASFVNTTNVVTFVSAVNAKNGMRINGASGEGIPDATGGTTILRNINTALGTAQMFDALTGVAVNANTTVGSIPVTLDNSGAAGGSHDLDAFQNITGSFEVRTHNQAAFDVTFEHTGMVTLGTGITNVEGVNTQGINRLAELINLDASDSPSARTHDQTQPISSAIFYYYKA